MINEKGKLEIWLGLPFSERVNLYLRQKTAGLENYDVSDLFPEIYKEVSK